MHQHRLKGVGFGVRSPLRFSPRNSSTLLSSITQLYDALLLMKRFTIVHDISIIGIYLKTVLLFRRLFCYLELTVLLLRRLFYYLYDVCFFSSSTT